MFCEFWCTECLRGCFGSESVDEELFSEVSGQASAPVCRSCGGPEEAQSKPESHCKAMACGCFLSRLVGRMMKIVSERVIVSEVPCSLLVLRLRSG